MRRGLCLAATLAVASSVFGAAAAQQPAYDDRAARQAQIDLILTRLPLERVMARRRQCALGVTSELNQAFDQFFADGVTASVADECLALLIRLGRERRLEPIASDQAPAAVALDTGFIAGYRQGGAMPAGLPTMQALKSVAERCLAQREPNARLCSAAGFGLGLRAFHGEVVAAD